MCQKIVYVFLTCKPCARTLRTGTYQNTTFRTRRLISRAERDDEKAWAGSLQNPPRPETSPSRHLSNTQFGNQIERRAMAHLQLLDDHR